MGRISLSLKILMKTGENTYSYSWLGSITWFWKRNCLLMIFALGICYLCVCLRFGSGYTSYLCLKRSYWILRAYVFAILSRIHLNSCLHRQLPVHAMDRNGSSAYFYLTSSFTSIQRLWLFSSCHLIWHQVRIQHCIVWVGCFNSRSSSIRLRSVSILEIHWLRQLQSSSFYVDTTLRPSTIFPSIIAPCSTRNHSFAARDLYIIEHEESSGID